MSSRDLVTEGRKPEMVRRLGATYVQRGDLGPAAEADIIIECTGHVDMLLDVGPQHVRHRITCLTGVSAAGTKSTIDPGLLNRNMVLQNSVLFGSVNANRHHYELAAKALAQADPGWLAGLITHQVLLSGRDLLAAGVPGLLIAGRGGRALDHLSPAGHRVRPLTGHRRPAADTTE